ncbi:unnamed protein product [Phytophthora lilii]|uniref:Unnamed protein product n=1 Tax=Phytophthora lilii TaxID=2077276 RepID=A0A9W6TVK4_9STRA|nr:unnamed protein product [Phytophthora lilii]
MREQICPVTPAPTPTANDLQIDTTLSPDPTQPKGKTGSPLDGWATFHPDKMPVRRCEPLIKAVSRSQQPGQPKQQKENFTARMEKDIFQRRSLKLQHDMKRQELEQEEANSISAVNLIAKGSQRILLKNGMWAESLEERISRLAKHRTKAEAGESRSKKRRKRLEQRKQEAAAVASRACESLYQRGIEQRRREQERLREDIHDLEFQRNRPKISSRSLRVMKARIRQELLQLCVDSQRTISNTEASHDEADRSQNDSSFVTFIQFSCALLYFGFVADLNTPWDGSTSVDNESKVTLLWHSWTVFSRDDSGVAAPKLAAKVLEQILFSVILGGRASDNSVLRGRDAQVLLRLYRANYYARKHTQLKSEPDDDRKQNRIKTDARSTEIKRSSSRRQRIRYSLHGKPIRQSDAPETDLLSEREQLLQEKIDQMREAKAKQELEGCTFHPHINPGPSEAAAQRTSQTPLQSPRPSSVTVSTFERLYSDAFQRQNNVLEKYLEAKQHREELEKRECTVHPSYVNGLTIEERLENLHVALAGNALPVDFRKKIHTMRTVTEMKARDEQMKQQRLQPAHFKKAKDGRTIVVPFQFATEIRSALSTELKKQRVKMAHRPRNHLMKGLRPPANEEDRIPAAVRSSREDTDIGEADLCLDVHLSPSETRQLYLNADDDPREVRGSSNSQTFRSSEYSPAKMTKDLSIVVAFKQARVCLLSQTYELTVNQNAACTKTVAKIGDMANTSRPAEVVRRRFEGSHASTPGVLQ